MFRLDHLNAFKVVLEHTRAEASDELIHSLSDYEQEESARFDRIQREWEDQRKDPDDVFFTERDREREIKEQIKNLQNSLPRQTGNRSPNKNALAADHVTPLRCWLPSSAHMRQSYTIGRFRGFLI